MRKIVICDDVEEERKRLKAALVACLAKLGEEADITEYASGIPLLSDVQEGTVEMDLLFLDIFMQDSNGMDTARRLRALSCSVPILFLTTSPDFAIESYDVEASAYLVKPLAEEKLEAALRRTLKAVPRRRIAVRSGGQYRYVYVADILYAESERHWVTLYMADGTSVKTLEKLGNIEEQIADPCFLRCHQSYLVNMDHIEDVQEGFCMANGATVPIRVRGRKEALDAYYAYFVRSAQ